MEKAEIAELIVGNTYFHKFRGKCLYTEACVELQKYNADPTSIFMNIDGEEQEVTLYLISKNEK